MPHTRNTRVTPAVPDAIRHFFRPLRFSGSAPGMPAGVRGRGIDALHADLPSTRATLTVSVSLREQMSRAEQWYGQHCGGVVGSTWIEETLNATADIPPRYLVKMEHGGDTVSRAVITHSVENPRTMFVILICAQKGWGTAAMNILRQIAEACSDVDYIHLHSISEAIGFYRRLGFKAGRPSRGCVEPPDVERAWARYRDASEDKHDRRMLKYLQSLADYNILAVGGCFLEEPCGLDMGYPMTLCLPGAQPVTPNVTWQVCSDCPKHQTQVVGTESGVCDSGECGRREQDPTRIVY